MTDDDRVAPALGSVTVDPEHDAALGVGQAAQRVARHTALAMVKLDREAVQAAVGCSELQEQSVEVMAQPEVAQLDVNARQLVRCARARS